MKTRLGVLFGWLLLASTAWAQYPSKPVRIVVPYPASGTQDLAMRLLQEPLGSILGQAVIVENRAGASGVIGMKDVQNSAPDGHSFALANNGMIITPLVEKGVTLDLVRDFTAVALVAEGPMVIFAHPSLPANNVKDLVTLAKAKPGALFYGSTGTGGLGHMAWEMLSHRSGAKLTHVPYKGNAPAVLAVLTGEVQMMMSFPSETTNENVKAGKMKVLGTTSLRSTPLLPGVSPVSDAVPGFNVVAWLGLMAPTGTPPNVVSTMTNALTRVYQRPDIQSRYAAWGLVPGVKPQAEFVEVLKKENSDWRAVVQAANLKTN